MPKSGNIVTFAYESYSRRTIPTNPKIYRIRGDVTWPEVLANRARELLNSMLFVGGEAGEGTGEGEGWGGRVRRESGEGRGDEEGGLGWFR